jgi:hypothetical protein
MPRKVGGNIRQPRASTLRLLGCLQLPINRIRKLDVASFQRCSEVSLQLFT